MNSYMLDTNICSYIIHRRPESVFRRMAEEVQAGSNIVISAIVYSELLYGATKPKAPKRLKDMLDEFIGGIDSILPLSAEAVEMDAKIQQDLQRKGV